MTVSPPDWDLRVNRTTVSPEHHSYFCPSQAVWRQGRSCWLLGQKAEWWMKDDGEKYTFTSCKCCHCFEFVTVKDAKNIDVRCKLCASRKMLSTTKNTTCWLNCWSIWYGSTAKWNWTLVLTMRQILPVKQNGRLNNKNWISEQLTISKEAGCR